ncbi:MAG: hypothetical protein HQL96_04045 [Magnetococcales bacterium]|nr:hypothetical protein [Magnetococcales bacterium]
MNTTFDPAANCSRPVEPVAGAHAVPPARIPWLPPAPAGNLRGVREFYRLLAEVDAQRLAAMTARLGKTLSRRPRSTAALDQ